MKYQPSQKKPINWLDEIKSAQDPVALSNLYIKNLKEELRVLESQNKTLKTRLGTFNFEAKKKPSTAIETLATSQQKHIELGQKASDFAKYPTTQKLSNLFVDETAFGSSAVRIEYIRELEFLVDALKKQNAELQELVQKPPLKTRPIVVPKKYEGHDCVDDEILIGKSTLVNVSKVRCEPYQHKLKPDNTLKDRQIQNLLEEKKLLEQEISMYKETEKTRKAKIEGHDLEKIMKKNDTNTIIYQAKQKYIKKSQQEEELKEKYLQALLQETFLLQQQLQKIQEESQHFDPHKKS